MDSLHVKLLIDPSMGNAHEAVLFRAGCYGAPVAILSAYEMDRLVEDWRRRKAEVAPKPANVLNDLDDNDQGTLDRLLNELGTSGLAAAIAELCEERAKEAEPSAGVIASWLSAARAYREVAV